MANVLVLGGTQFIGRNLVERLIEMGAHDVTLFNRGRTQTDLFPEVSRILGDRETDDVLQLKTRQWDFVIDLSCYYPNSLETALQSVGPVKKYIFVSTCSVYDNTIDQSILRNEDAVICSCSEEQRVNREWESYGNRKAECERILAASGVPHVVFRPALVYGRYDHTDRFYYWLNQVCHHSPLLLPDNGERTFSLTYVHDLVNALVASLSSPVTGVFNAVSVPRASIRQIVTHASKVLNTTPQLLNASPEFLRNRSIQPWADMPLWLDCDYFTYDNTRFREAFQMTPTDLENSIQQTVTYFDDLSWPEPHYGITEDQRQELIQNLR